MSALLALVLHLQLGACPNLRWAILPDRLEVPRPRVVGIIIHPRFRR